MRQPLFLAILALPIFTAAALADCSEDLRLAMKRAVTSGPYRVESTATMPDAVSESRIDIVPGKAMHAVSTSGDLHYQTIVIGQRAWMNTDGSWQEMPAEMAAATVAGLKSAAADPDTLGAISGETCLGAGVVDGRDVLRYSYDMRASGAVGHSDVLVDADTGLPIRTETQTTISGMVSKIVSTYTYDAAITVEAPL
jgi:hypothetical protein